jgi:transcriptional regulator with XRE-family HTH domain
MFAYMPTNSLPRRPRPPLRDVRRTKGLGLREVARRANVDPAHLSRIERGQAQPSYSVLYRLARVLGDAELVRALAPYARGDE